MASHYNLVDYDSDEERRPVLRANLFAAAIYMQDLLQANNAIWAFMGGFGLICRSSRRDTQDVDLVTNLHMKDIRAINEPQPR